MAAVQLVTVSPEESGQKLLNFLQRRVGKDIPKSALQRAIRKGWVRVDKGRKKPFDKVKTGQTVRIPPFHSEEKKQTPQQLGPLDIIHESASILVLHKPCGLPVHGGSNHTDSLADRVKGAYAKAPFTPAPAHRLDKNTSGVLVFGKSYEALRSLQDQFSEHTAIKIYFAWVKGSLNLPVPELMEDKMQKKTRHGELEKVHAGQGKTARSRMVSITEKNGWTLVAIQLLTGRTHQIRVQLSSRGYPIAGDVKYGSPQNLNLPSQCPMLLHATALKIHEGYWSVLPTWGKGWKVSTEHVKIAQSVFDI
ncbi:MAG: RluA family pseudouridine synthase [Desulfovibrio sp.]